LRDGHYYNNIFNQDNCLSFRKKLLSMQVVLLKKTDNNVIYKSKKINYASAYIHHNSRLVLRLLKIRALYKRKIAVYT